MDQESSLELLKDLQIRVLETKVFQRVNGALALIALVGGFSLYFRGQGDLWLLVMMISLFACFLVSQLQRRQLGKMESMISEGVVSLKDKSHQTCGSMDPRETKAR